VKRKGVQEEGTGLRVEEEEVVIGAEVGKQAAEEAKVAVVEASPDRALKPDLS